VPYKLCHFAEDGASNEETMLQHCVELRDLLSVILSDLSFEIPYGTVDSIAVEVVESCWSVCYVVASSESVAW